MTSIESYSNRIYVCSSVNPRIFVKKEQAATEVKFPSHSYLCPTLILLYIKLSIRARELNVEKIGSEK